MDSGPLTDVGITLEEILWGDDGDGHRVKTEDAE